MLLGLAIDCNGQPKSEVSSYQRVSHISSFFDRRFESSADFVVDFLNGLLYDRTT